jgi:hypothetical protein
MSDPGPIEDHPAYRDLMDALAVEIEHLDPTTAPKGEYTTRIDLLRALLERMLNEGQDQRTHAWIIEFLGQLDDRDFMQAQFEYLDRLDRERRGDG